MSKLNRNVITFAIGLIVISSCSFHKSRMPQRPMTFKDSFLVSVLENGDTISPDCLDEINNFKNGLTYSEVGRFYRHIDQFDIAFFEVLPCLKNIKIASWYLLFPEMKYVVPWTNTLEPYYFIKTVNMSGTTGFTIIVKDSFFVNGGPNVFRKNASDPIGY